MAACNKFIAFHASPEVCDTCGSLASEHSTFSTFNDFREDLWKALLKHGSIASYFGGTDTFKDLEMRVHLGLSLSQKGWQHVERINRSSWGSKIDIPERPCPINWDETGDPVFDAIYEFDGTECDSARIPAIVGRLTCKCRKLWQVDISLIDKTMGQLMWLVNKEAASRES